MKQYIVGQGPDCCEKGNIHITLQAKNFVFSSDFTGWGLSVNSRSSQEVEQIFYCPFCGKKLEEIND